MPEFKGFPEGKVHQIGLPAQFFTDLLPSIENIGELKVTLYVFWRLDRMEGSFRYLRWSDFHNDRPFFSSLGKDPESALSSLEDGLRLAILRGTLLSADIGNDHEIERIYLLNSPKGRAALRAIETGKWKPEIGKRELADVASEPPNIFRLYEENIGMITPMIAEALSDAEREYPLTWIEEAIRISVQNNKRSWRYAQTILERWQREGKHGSKEKPEDRPTAEEARRRYVEGEFSDFIEH